MVDLIEFPTIAAKLKSFAYSERSVVVKFNDHPETHNRGRIQFGTGPGNYYLAEADLYFEEEQVLALADSTTIILERWES